MASEESASMDADSVPPAPPEGGFTVPKQKRRRSTRSSTRLPLSQIPSTSAFPPLADTPVITPPPSTPQGSAPAASKVVIIDNVAENGFTNRKSIEIELHRVAPWLQARSISYLLRGGIRISCSSQEDASKLIARTGWPENAFHQRPDDVRTRVRVHYPGSQDPNQGIQESASSAPNDSSEHQRTVIINSIPGDWSDDEITATLEAVVSVRTIGNKDPLRPPLRAMVFRDVATCTAALQEGVRFFNRIVRCRRCHPRRKPVRCARCQAVEVHSTFDCTAEQPTCATCAGSHLTSNCPDPEVRKCCRCGESHSAAYLSCRVARGACERAQRLRLDSAPVPPPSRSAARPDTQAVTMTSSTPSARSGWPSLPSRPSTSYRPQRDQSESAALSSVTNTLSLVLPQLLAVLTSIQEFMASIQSRTPPMAQPSRTPICVEPTAP